ncbi:hypothetical protein UQ64_16120 [Paenibacillus etheri]|uniref:Uncharacterized protein n=1 Tax=Paenibacillus etheri TaxID=1306852 RepID=A0A0W1AY44_9BACL|nr:hypothetical protein UQ64_16120 [Paenibacillus etheri]
MVSILCAVAINAFFFPRRAANFQYFEAKYVFFVRDAAHADSARMDFRWGLPWRMREDFFFQHFRSCLGINRPKKPDGARNETEACPHQPQLKSRKRR